MRGKQTFDVPNDSEGREFLRLLKKFKAPGHSYRARGRGPRKAPGDNYVSGSRQGNLPHAYAKSFAVYMGKKAETTFIADEQLDYRQQSLLRKAERGELREPLTQGENELLTHAVESLIEECNSVMTEEEWDTIEEIQDKLDLDK